MQDSSIERHHFALGLLLGDTRDVNIAYNAASGLAEWHSEGSGRRVVQGSAAGTRFESRAHRSRCDCVGGLQAGTPVPTCRYTWGRGGRCHWLIAGTAAERMRGAQADSAEGNTPEQCPVRANKGPKGKIPDNVTVVDATPWPSVPFPSRSVRRSLTPVRTRRRRAAHRGPRSSGPTLPMLRMQRGGRHEWRQGAEANSGVR